MRLLLYPLSLLFGLVVRFRNFMFDLGILTSEQFSFPVISIGNITVGGTGKTPHVEYLTRLLDKEFKVSVLSRGYKRKTKGFVLATENSNSAEIGDESAQIKQKYPNVAVAVCEKRVEGINRLVTQKIDLVLLDDAFQHRYVKPGLSILLIDFYRRLENDYLLPFGNLRENQEGIKRADIIIITKTPVDLKPIDRRIIFEQIKPAPYQELYFTGLNYGKFKPVFETQSSILNDFHNNYQIYTILLVTGIAFPKPLIENLQKYTMDIRHVKFEDHSDYNEVKIKKIEKLYSEIDNDKKIIFTTEKDAVKIRETGISNNLLVDKMFYIPVEIIFLDKEEEFNKKIIEYVKQNKRNN